jgi:hypothetical protein
MNDDLKTYQEGGQKEEPWMTERPRYGLYHELIHAYHASRGDDVPGTHSGESEKGEGEDEFQDVGLGPYENDEVTDNRIRGEMGKARRPSYHGETYWETH